MKKKKVIISLLILLGIIGIIPKSYGAISVRPSATADASRVSVNSSITKSYMVCQQMKDNGGSLYGSQLKPHLATNTDWGAVSYFSNSVYGTNTQGQNTGVIKNINGVDYYSTNGNETGVMNWGCNPYLTLYTQTAGLTKAYMDLEDTTTSEAHNNVFALETAARSNSEYVDVMKRTYIAPDETLGMALAETKNYSFISWTYFGNSSDYPISIRKGLFEYRFGMVDSRYQYNANATGPSGRGYGDVTFRPVVYN